MKEEISIEKQLIADETEKRLIYDGKKDYPFPKVFKKRLPWVVIGVGVNLSLVILAMSGVIQ